MPRTGSSPKDDQQRMQQYNRMLSARNLQHSSLSPGSHSGAERGVRMLPARNGVGVMPGMDRSMTMARPGFRGVASSSVLNSGSVLSPGMAAANPANMHPRIGPGQGNSTLRARDAMHLMKPNQNGDHRRQILPADFQMQQVSQGGSSQGVSHLASGTSSTLSNQVAQPPFQSYAPDHHQQPHPVSAQQPPHVLGSNSHNRNNLHGTPNHATNTSHPAFGMRILKERQLQQQRVLQQQQIAMSNAQKSQLPISSPQNGTQIQSQSSLPVLHSPMGTPSMGSMAQNTQKHPLLAAPNPQTGGNQILKQQRQSQQFMQQQQALSQPQTKFMKGGRGALIPVDPTLQNGLSGDQSVAEKGEQLAAHHLLKSGQRNLNPSVQTTSKHSVPHSSLSQPHQQKAYSGQMQVASSNKLQQLKPSLLSDTSNHLNHAPPSLVASSSTMSVVTSSNHQHPLPQPHPKLVSLSRAATAKRTVNNRSVNSSEPPTCKLQASSVGISGEHSGPEVNQSMVHGQPSPDSLPNPVGHDVGVQWPPLPSS
ncbi:hypothetical protein Ccrd_003707 [Cynara cardunculus var. scolymus]|uniref:Uncharacterized protein n=1 Tax=Cynara cardunculus var. scolymus TaxID=59895 RepID=A0A118JVS4_CYNCS|nr:hypothetical protein Ccrd_003707 [Cynara cardunculus var. scolymus]